MIYCLLENAAALGPRLVYHDRVLRARHKFLKGDCSEDTILHAQPEALERMHGHAIPSHFIDAQGRRISNKLLFGKKMINGQWIEGVYMLGFTTIGGQLTCYHSFFKAKPFAEAIKNMEIAPADLAELQRALSEIA